MSQGIKFDAIKALGVQYGFSVQEDLSVVWHTEPDPKPTDAEIEAKYQEMIGIHSSQQYMRNRVHGIGNTSGYAVISEQLDQLYHDINAGKFGADAKTGNWFVGITSVKTNIPKPS